MSLRDVRPGPDVDTPTLLDVITYINEVFPQLRRNVDLLPHNYVLDIADLSDIYRQTAA